MKKLIAASLVLAFFVLAVVLIRHATRLDSHIKGAYNPQRTFRGRRPPLPNFREPVDYIAWSNEYLLEGKDQANAATYDGFWRSAGDQWSPDNEQYMPDPPEPVKERLRKLIRGPVWKPGQYPQTEAYTGSVEPYIALFRREANKPEYCLQLKTDSDSDPNIPNCGGILPSIGLSRYAVWILLAQAWRQGEHQPDRMREALQIGLRHSNHLAASGAMILHIQASSIRLMLYQSVRDALRYNVIDRPDYKAALDVLIGSEQPGSGLHEALFSEWGGLFGYLQALYPRGKLNRTFAEQLVSFNGTSTTPVVDQSRALRLRPDRLVPFMDEYFVKILSVIEKPLSIDSLQEIRRLEADADCGLPSEHPLRWLVQPELDRVYLLALRTLTSLRATVMLLLLHEYRAKEGRWPDSLEQLDVPDGSQYLIDPFSERPFFYRRTEESFLLYSVSEDRIDNAGTHKSWNRYRETKHGTDFVFWPVQP